MMNATVGEISHIAVLLIAVAALTMVLGSKNSSSIITSIGNTFTGGLNAAMGK